MYQIATQSFAWLISDNRTRVRRSSSRVSSPRSDAAEVSDETTAEGLLSGVAVLALSVVVIMAAGWMARELMTELAGYGLGDLLRGMSGV